MPPLPRFDHVGITVLDLAGVQTFFETLGLVAEGEPQVVEGHFVSAVVGLDDVRVLNVLLRTPDGGTRLELSQFLSDHGPAEPDERSAYRPGLCNVCFEVDDLQAVVDRAARDGYGLVGEVADYEDVWRMAYLRGPEQLIVSLAQALS